MSTMTSATGNKRGRTEGGRDRSGRGGGGKRGRRPYREGREPVNGWNAGDEKEARRQFRSPRAGRGSGTASKETRECRGEEHRDSESAATRLPWEKNWGIK